MLTLDSDVYCTQIDCEDYAFTVEGDHTLYIRGDSYNYNGIHDSSLFTLNSGTIAVGSAKNSSDYGVRGSNDGNKIVINGGTLTVTNCDYGIEARSDIVINGGVIDVDIQYTGIQSRGGSLKITGGDINVTTPYYTSGGYNSAIQASGVTITGGNINCLGTIRSDGNCYIGGSANVSATSGSENQPAIYEFYYDGREMKISGIIETPASGKVMILDSGGGAQWYTVSADGKTNASEVVIKGNANRNGWVDEGGTLYYYKDNVIQKNSLVKDSGKWYYTDENGAMFKGWKKFGNNMRYFKPDGTMATGLTKATNGNWYFFNSNGYRQYGLQKTGGSWRYFQSGTGVMAVGWVKFGSNFRYFAPNGVMATGLTKATNGNWYYFNGSGIRQYGWVKFGSKYRYFQSNGVKLANCTKKISGKNYKFNSSGICTNK